MPNQPTNPEEIQKAFVEYDRRAILSNVKVGCVIGIVLMPAGVILDHFVYKNMPDVVANFLKLRLLCSLLIALFWGVVVTPFGRRHPRKLGVLLAMFPSFFISCMIYSEGGSESLYYAGLNLVLLVVGFVLYWTFAESFLAVTAVLTMYVTACVLHGKIFLTTDFISNIYFLVLTGIVVVTGSYFHSKSRFREFALRFELDRQFKQLQEAEAELVQTEKLASLGRLSAGIIHEINNPLNFATTGLFTLRNKGKLLPPEKQADYADILKDVEEGITRVKTIVSDLRGFSHHDNAAVDEVDVSEVVTQSLRFMSHEWRDVAELEQKLTEHQTIWANKNKLIQVIVNLVQNSLDALKAKAFTNGEKPTVWIESCIENSLSILRIRDNGEGIAPENLGKIFDPFFTTKDVGEGMGLGLSICYRIVEEYGGRIAVKSELGKFTEFSLEFPLKG